MRKKLISVLLLLLGALFAGPTNAETALKFTLDFISFGPNSPFVYTDEHGYFKDTGLSVKI